MNTAALLMVGLLVIGVWIGFLFVLGSLSDNKRELQCVRLELEKINKFLAECWNRRREP